MPFPSGAPFIPVKLQLVHTIYNSFSGAALLFIYVAGLISQISILLFIIINCITAAEVYWPEGPN